MYIKINIERILPLTELYKAWLPISNEFIKVVFLINNRTEYKMRAKIDPTIIPANISEIKCTPR